MLPKSTIIIQARMGSTRFPKKVLTTIEKKPIIWHVINRTRQVRNVEQIILATTTKKEDQILLEIAKESEIKGFAGSDEDVLDRFYQCSKKFDADPIIRITADCPLIDQKIIENLLRYYEKHDVDYATNTLPPTFPDGLDVEIFSIRVLEQSWKKSHLKSEREHVTPFIRKNPDKFKIYNLANKIDLSEYRLTVDEKIDLEVIRKIYSKMKPNLLFGLEEILQIISNNQKLTDINKKIRRNEGYLISSKNDQKFKGNS